MRFFIFILLYISTIYGKGIYEIQLLATKATDSIDTKRMIARGKSAGLSCYTIKEDRADGAYLLVRCDETTKYKNIKKSIKKAKKAGLDYYLLKHSSSDESVNKDSKSEPSSIRERVKVDDLEDFLFGNNEELIEVLNNKAHISSAALEQKKETYLKNIASSEKISGFSLRGKGSNNFDIERTAYNLRLQWDILDGGYLGSQKDVKKTILRKELEYDRIMDEYRQSNLELSLYKMNFISNYINYTFLRQQEHVLFNIVKRAQKKYKASLITSETLLKRKKAYEHIKNTLSYYNFMEKEQYDKRLKPIVSKIEDITLADKLELAQYAYLNSFEIKNSHNKIEISSIKENWVDKLKTNVYVEEKKIVYLNDSETVAGFQVQIPLDFNNDNSKFSGMEIEVNRLKEQSLKSVIARTIDDIYHKIDYHKNDIQTIKNEIIFLKNEIKSLKLKSKYPLQKQTKDLRYELEMLNLSVSKDFQKIWQERTEIMKLLIKLQNISGMQVLPAKW